MEDIRNTVLIIAGILASVKTALELFDRMKKRDNED